MVKISIWNRVFAKYNNRGSMEEHQAALIYNGLSHWYTQYRDDKIVYLTDYELWLTAAYIARIGVFLRRSEQRTLYGYFGRVGRKKVVELYELAEALGMILEISPLNQVTLRFGVCRIHVN